MYQELLKGSTLNNLFDTHPPFQIDGNFGATSGIAEMLLQSHLIDIQLLPALPGAWKKGFVGGLVARGNFVIDMSWDEGKLTKANISARSGGTCIIRTTVPVRILNVKTATEKVRFKEETHYVTTFISKRGASYQLIAQ
jgi:alpha-L-fucosidase 2